VIDDVDPAQDVRAFRAACEKAPHLPPDPGYFVRTVRPAGPRYVNQPCDPPGLAPQRACAVVSYEPISLDELAEWRNALDDRRKTEDSASGIFEPVFERRKSRSEKEKAVQFSH